MPITNARELSVARSADAAESMAAALVQAADALTGSTPVMETARRQLRKLAHELCELHSLKAAEVFGGGSDTGGNRNGASEFRDELSAAYASSES